MAGPKCHLASIDAVEYIAIHSWGCLAGRDYSVRWLFHEVRKIVHDASYCTPSQAVVNLPQTRSCSTDSPCFHSHLIGACRCRVHIGVLSIRMVLQSFCRPRRPGKKHAVTVNTVSFCKLSCSASVIMKTAALGPSTHLGNVDDTSRRSWCDGTVCDVIKRMVRITSDP